MGAFDKARPATEPWSSDPHGFPSGPAHGIRGPVGLLPDRSGQAVFGLALGRLGCREAALIRDQ